MSLPRYDELIVPALELLKNNTEIKLRGFEPLLAEKFNLTSEEIEVEYKSGNGRIFYDRIAWAVSYLNMSGLAIKPKRGIYAISDLGKTLITTPEKVLPYVHEQIAKRDRERVKEKKEVETNSGELTPEEELYKTFDGIKETIYQEVLDTILNKSPREFEKLVVQLLQKMGYGGELENSGEVTQYTNDGGIDGIIKEDILGLGRIHIQAKRYAADNAIGREEIQKFVGALAVAQSNKGVFITTSYFAKSAIQYCQNLNATTTVVLIDGMKLSEYIYNFNLGMQTEKVIEIKKLDSDFWDSMIDE